MLHLNHSHILPAAALLLTLSSSACDDGTASPSDADVTTDATDQADIADVTEDAAPDADDATEDEELPSTPYTDSLLLSDRFLNIAHRGGRRLAPEETLVAFQSAVDVGADVLELDVHTTSDGVLVVMHDDDVDRTTDGSGAIHGMTFDELRLLDAGYHFTTDGGETFPHRGQGVVVPTLEEVLTAFPEMHFVIELKQLVPSISEDVVALIEELEMESQVCLASFSDAVLAEVREANPDLITSYGFVEIFTFRNLTDDDEATYVPAAELMQVPPKQGELEVLTPEFLARAHRLGIKVQVWTINDRAEMESMVEMGVDGVLTDDPETLADVIETTGIND